mgnify:CR=1 FL=1
MSIKGIYTATSGAIAQSDKLDTIANNIANADTTAFKRDQQVFKEYLTSAEKEGEVIQAPVVPASIDSFYPIDGKDKSYVDSVGTFTTFEQGSVRPTSNPLERAIEGDGMWEWVTPNGLRYTRNGSFTLNNQGQLVTKQGFPVLRQGAGMGPARFIQLGQAQDWNVSQDGDIAIDGEVTGKIAMSTAKDKNVFMKEGNSLYTLRPTVASPVLPSNTFKVHQGAIEKSNVNLVNEMTEMIKTSRTFEATQKAIQAYDQMNARIANDITRLK